MHRLWIALGALAGLLGVALSAWSAHDAPALLGPDRLAVLDRAISMLLWHAVALLGAGLWAERRGTGLAQAAAAALALGTALFCGAVLVSVLAGISLGPTAPAGGLLLMLGWALLALSALLPARGR